VSRQSIPSTRCDTMEGACSFMPAPRDKVTELIGKGLRVQLWLRLMYNALTGSRVSLSEHTGKPRGQPGIPAAARWPIEPLKPRMVAVHCRQKGSETRLGLTTTHYTHTQTQPPQAHVQTAPALPYLASSYVAMPKLQTSDRAS
jgi:hypothetical protein